MPKTVSGGVINGKAIDLPKPVYPAAARAVRASGVEVLVRIHRIYESFFIFTRHFIFKQFTIKIVKTPEDSLKNMNFDNIVGQTLDDKYKIEKELGKGGMGAVFLSTHVGTERPVAVKVIVPEFMERAEFVERFRREARAAGRLRHPNVVDVTDFGIADTACGQVAYLVMEYLDGCTLGEILDEEKNLPVDWTLDILEQVCSAVHEAHLQGIIHRDLKPDNIWLRAEPARRLHGQSFGFRYR